MSDIVRYTDETLERAAKRAARKAAYNDIDQSVEAWRIATKLVAAQAIAETAYITVENATEVGRDIAEQARAATTR